MIGFAQYGLIVLLSVSLVFHFGVILKIVPYSIVWGGRLKSDTEMYRFEIVSILINFVFLFIILVQSGYVVCCRSSKNYDNSVVDYGGTVSV